MEISSRDKKLLIGLLIVAVLAGGYFLVITPLLEDIEKTNVEITKLEAELDRLTALNLQVPAFREAIETYKFEIAEIVSQFPTGIRQENIIMFYQDMEESLPIQMYQIAFTNSSTIPIGVINTDMSEVLGIENSIMEYAGVTSSQTVGYRVPYHDFKKFINRIELWQDRLTITGLTAAYDIEANEVNGNFTINQYAISGETLDYEQVDTDVLQGSDNIFLKPTDEWQGWEDDIWNDLFEEGDDSLEDEEVDSDITASADECDIFFMLSQPQAEIDAMIIAINNSNDASTILSADENMSRLARFSFTQNDGKYYVTYKLSYATRTKEITPGDKIVLNVYSTVRVGAEDHVASSLAISNGTNKNVIVNIINDDINNPRVTIREKTPNVQIVY